MSPQRAFRALAIRDVHDHADEFVCVAGLVEHRLTSDVQVADRVIGPHDANIHLIVALLAHRLIDRPVGKLPIVGVPELGEQLTTGVGRLGINAEDTKDFLRPVDLSRRDPSSPAARIAQLLCGDQIRLAAVQLVIEALALGDVYDAHQDAVERQRFGGEGNGEQHGEPLPLQCLQHGLGFEPGAPFSDSDQLGRERFLGLRQKDSLE
jgi:hypothetical protein